MDLYYRDEVDYNLSIWRRRLWKLWFGASVDRRSRHLLKENVLKNISPTKLPLDGNSGSDTPVTKNIDSEESPLLAQ